MPIPDVMDTLSSAEPADPKGNVQWGPVLAGASIATATGLILLTFGAALGLSVASPYDGEGLSPIAFAVAAGLYILWVQVMSFYMGGYVAGRMRTRAAGSSEHEADVRDGLHGLVSWSIGVIAAAVITFAGVGGMGLTAKSAPNQVAASVSQVVDQQVNANAAPTRAVDTPANSTQAQRRADLARKASIISAFVTAASLLVGAVAAFYGAHSGGNHRDRNVVWGFFASHVRSQKRRG